MIPVLALGFIASRNAGPAVPGNNENSIDPSMLSDSINPGDDFYDYVNARWNDMHPIPPDRSRYGAFDMLIDKSMNTLHEVMQSDAKANAETGTNTQKVGDFWISAMDTTAIENAGISGLDAYVGRIDNLRSKSELIRTIAKMHRLYASPAFSSNVEQDPGNSANQILSIGQGGLGLPDRDYYFRTDPTSQQIRDAYMQHVTNMLKLMGEDEATASKNAMHIMQIETVLAGASMTNVQLRDPYATYHMTTLTDLQASTPDIDWTAYFEALQAPAFTSLNVAQPDYFKTVDSLVANMSMEIWAAYLKYTLVNNYAGYLSTPFVNEDFDFYKKTLRGQDEMQPRWKRVVQTADFCLGEALGQEYVRVAFSAESKQRMLDLVGNLRTSLAERIRQLSWMDDSTKQFALQKLNAMNVKIGYPDKWRDYSNLVITKDSYVMNVARSLEFESQRQLDKIGKPVDKSEWLMTPQTVNAYYDQSNNEIVFPAAILQPPFYDPSADDAVNYGGIGAVIGHEMTHGFDDQGRLYDAEGNLNDWWSKSDEQQFEQHTQRIVDEYSNFYPLDSVHINGNLTLGENIADFGGLTVAYHAFLKTAEAKSGQSINGFTPAQRFFLGFAHIWAGSYKEGALRTQLLTNPHSPGKYRVNGVLPNMPEWYTAFHVTSANKMYIPEEKRAVIW